MKTQLFTLFAMTVSLLATTPAHADRVTAKFKKVEAAKHVSVEQNAAALATAEKSANKIKGGDWKDDELKKAVSNGVSKDELVNSQTYGYVYTYTNTYYWTSTYFWYNYTYYTPVTYYYWYPTYYYTYYPTYVVNPYPCYYVSL